MSLLKSILSIVGAAAGAYTAYKTGEASRQQADIARKAAENQARVSQQAAEIQRQAVEGQVAALREGLAQRHVSLKQLKRLIKSNKI